MTIKPIFIAFALVERYIKNIKGKKKQGYTTVNIECDDAMTNQSPIKPAT